jgi:hypothetical protein
MINAKEARKKSEINATILISKEIEENIKKAIAKGRTQCTFCGTLPQELITTLEDNGYTLSNGLIKW